MTVCFQAVYRPAQTIWQTETTQVVLCTFRCVQFIQYMMYVSGSVHLTRKYKSCWMIQSVWHRHSLQSHFPSFSLSWLCAHMLCSEKHHVLIVSLYPSPHTHPLDVITPGLATTHRWKGLAVCVSMANHYHNYASVCMCHAAQSIMQNG